MSRNLLLKKRYKKIIYTIKEGFYFYKLTLTNLSPIIILTDRYN